jgi:hypothetical protein
MQCNLRCCYILTSQGNRFSSTPSVQKLFLNKPWKVFQSYCNTLVSNFQVSQVLSKPNKTYCDQKVRGCDLLTLTQFSGLSMSATLSPSHKTLIAQGVWGSQQDINSALNRKWCGPFSQLLPLRIGSPTLHNHIHLKHATHQNCIDTLIASWPL